MPRDPLSVRQYYDHNTRRFLRRGQHQHTYNIHQPLWVGDAINVEQAVSHSNHLILQELNELANSYPNEELQVLDLGCGVGSSSLYLSQHFKGGAGFTGISISPVQIEYALGFKKGQKWGERCQFITGDFMNLPELPPMHLAFAIEAFLHAPNPRQFFEQVAKKLKPGGRLVLIDDFLTSRGDTDGLSPKEQQWLTDFRSGWLAESLITEEYATSLAEPEGLQFVESENLTPFMKLGRPRDQLIGLMRKVAAPYMRRSTYWRALNGGYAKQQCLKGGLVEYRKAVWEKNQLSSL